MTQYQHPFDTSFSDSLRYKRDRADSGYLKSALDTYLDDAREFNKQNSLAATSADGTTDVTQADDTDYSAYTYDQVMKESILKRHRIDGTYDAETGMIDDDSYTNLIAKMKYNPAATPENYKAAFGKCDAFGCYWPEDNPEDFYSVGKGGGTDHAKRGQAAARAKAAHGRSYTAAAGGRHGIRGGFRRKRTAPGGPDGKSQSRGAMRSDIQLKENITYINQSPNGHSIYEWNYKGEPKSRRYQGVMAQELLQTAPEAVVTMDNGYLGVDYGKIDVDFTTA